MSEYVRLVEEARDALGALLRASEPGTLLELHGTYNLLKNVAAKAAGDETAHKGRVTGAHVEPIDWRRETSVREREHLVLGALADQRRTVTELYEQMRDELAERHPGWTIERSAVASTINRLYASGDLDRSAEDYCGKPRYRYFRRAQLQGPIAELQRALDESPDA